MNIKNKLEEKPVHASVPCRIDLGGTLDISSFYLPMRALSPATFNIALNLRTEVTLSSWQKGYVKVSSKGFVPAVFKKDEAPFHHPMGLMFAVAKYFNADGVHIHIESASPPRSALGGSSAAAVAIISAFDHLMDKPVSPSQTAWLAHYIESSVAGVPCGMQDQLAAAYGGVNQWIWKMGRAGPLFRRKQIFNQTADIDAFNSNILVAYCGIPHVSKDINKQWVDSFLKGETRRIFEKIVGLTKDFSKAVKKRNYRQAADLMAQETNLRLEMTPEVLDNTGKKLFESAIGCNCGARFTGAGGGGCLWAIGEAKDLELLKFQWQEILLKIEGAGILETKIETNGIIIH
ncbi:MAG: galactokinase [Desulfobacula sp. RIFOXYB2_FULL_45_6]|nr:MAG: galactokinase [Desulfobacula sp. RIFOXYB2_FULL_45_6]